MFWNQWEYLGGVCFLTFSDLRHFWWSKGGVENRDGAGGEEGKCFLNCQMVRELALQISFQKYFCTFGSGPKIGAINLLFLKKKYRMAKVP